MRPRANVLSIKLQRNIAKMFVNQHDAKRDLVLRCGSKKGLLALPIYQHQGIGYSKLL